MGEVDQLVGRELAEPRAFHRPGRATDAPRHGADAVHVSLANAEGVAHEKGADLVALDDALSELATFDERQSKIVEMRFFGGLSLEETAEALKISTRTVQREWSLAQAWLYRELSGKA
jgi:RNA polymerase sigma factor (TIGR02999 family)